MLFLEESQNRKNISANLYFYLFEGFINNDYEICIYTKYIIAKKQIHI